jgi:hypothetical protein
MSPMGLARVAGSLYLVLAVAGGFAQLVARGSVRVAGDAAATADNIRASSTLFTIGFVADAVNILFYISAALVLYLLLSPTSRNAAATFVIFSAIAVAIMGSALAAHAGALVLATDPTYVSALGASTADALAALSLDLHGYGYLVAEIFFGLWLLPLGYAVYRSGLFPRVLGIGLMVGAFGYLASFGATVTSPGFGESDLSLYLAVPAGVAEVAFVLWLLIKGAKAEPRGESSPAVGAAPAAA